MSDEWLEDLKPLGTDWQKPYLEIASYIIVVFKRSFGYTADRQKRLHYYAQESVCLAMGFLIIPMR